MSLENELNEILENTDKVYAAGQTSIAETKMDKFGTYTPGNSIEDIPATIDIDESGLYFTKKTSSCDHNIGLNYYLGPTMSSIENTKSDKDMGTILAVQPEGLALLVTVEGQQTEGLTFMYDSAEGTNLEELLKGLWIKKPIGALQLEGETQITCKVGNSYFIIGKGGTGMASIDTENWTEKLLPMIGKTDAENLDSFVTVSYLEEYIKTLEDRIKSLEGGTE